MKKSLHLGLLALLGLFLTSCCGIFSCENPNTVLKDVTETKYKTVSTVVDGGYGAKGGVAYSTEEKVPYEVTTQVRVSKCTACLSRYCPTPGCCGTVGKQVLARRTAQGSTGEPHIGLIPTMKVLAPE